MVVGRKVMVTLRVRVPMVAITVTLYSAKGDEAENVRIRLELALLLGERKMLPGMRLTSGPSLMEGRTMAERLMVPLKLLELDRLTVELATPPS